MVLMNHDVRGEGTEGAKDTCFFCHQSLKCSGAFLSDASECFGSCIPKPSFSWSFCLCFSRFAACAAVLPEQPRPGQEAQDLIRALIKAQPSDRLSLDCCLSHSWSVAVLPRHGGRGEVERPSSPVYFLSCLVFYLAMLDDGLFVGDGKRLVLNRVAYDLVSNLKHALPMQTYLVQRGLNLFIYIYTCFFSRLKWPQSIFQTSSCHEGRHKTIGMLTCLCSKEIHRWATKSIYWCHSGKSVID